MRMHHVRKIVRLFLIYGSAQYSKTTESPMSDERYIIASYHG